MLLRDVFFGMSQIMKTFGFLNRFTKKKVNIIKPKYSKN